MTTSAVAPTRSWSLDFYAWMAVACAIVAFGGFASTYWLQLLAGTFVPAPPLVHLHAALFFGWTLFFISQTVFVSKGDVATHRASGLFGIALATAMVVVGMTTAIAAMRHGIATGHAEAARSFLIVPVSAIVGFGLLFAGAVANVSRPEWHKRLMVAATVTLLGAAVARVMLMIHLGGIGPGVRPGTLPPPPLILGVLDAFPPMVLLLAGAIHDWRTRGRPHPAYWIGIGVNLALAAIRMAGESPAWLRSAEFLGGFAG